jgi:Tfp pilus assembly protein PilN
MKAPVLNLSLRPFRNENLYRLIFASCIGVLALLSLSSLLLIARSGWTLLSARGELRAQRAEIADLEQKDAALGRRLAAADSAMLQKRADFANGAILNRVFSWTMLFNELEKVLPPEVRLRSVRPAVNPHGKVDILLEGSARNYGAFVELEEALMRSSSFSRVYPGSERLETPAYRAAAPALPLAAPRPAPAAGGAGELAFSLSFEYFPGGRPAADEAGGGAGR